MSKKLTLKNEARYSEVGFTPNVLHDVSPLRVVVIALKKGQEIQPHAGEDGMFYIAEGEGIFYTQEGDIDITAGDIVIVEQGERRGMRAVEDLLVLVARAGESKER